MKNTEKNIKAAAAKIAKNEKLFISYIEKYIYITNSYYLIKIDPYTYNLIFRKAAPDYIELQPGENAGRPTKKDLIEKGRGVDLTGILKQDAGDLLIDTGYISAASNGRMFAGPDYITAVNNDFLELLCPFITLPLHAAGDLRPIIDSGLYDEAAAFGCMLLPIKYDLTNEEFLLTPKSEASGDDKKKAAGIVALAKEEARTIKEAAEKEAARIIEEAKKEAQKEKQPEKKEEKQEQKAAFSIVENKEKNGIELYFEAVPTAKIRNLLKVNNFHWHATKKCWYAKNTEKTKKIIEQLAA